MRPAPGTHSRVSALPNVATCTGAPVSALAAALGQLDPPQLHAVTLKTAARPPSEQSPSAAPARRNPLALQLHAAAVTFTITIGHVTSRVLERQAATAKDRR